MWVKVKNWWLDKPCLMFLIIGVILMTLPWYLCFSVAIIIGFYARVIDDKIRGE